MIESLAHTAARRTRRLSTCTLPYDELAQIARIAGYRAVVENYTPGRPVQRLVWCAMTRAIRRESWSAAFIVSGFRHRGGAAMGTATGWGGYGAGDDPAPDASDAGAGAPARKQATASGSAFVTRDPLPDAIIAAEQIENAFRQHAADAGFSVAAVDVLLDYRDKPNNRVPLWEEVRTLTAWAATDAALRVALIGEE